MKKSSRRHKKRSKYSKLHKRKHTENKQQDIKDIIPEPRNMVYIVSSPSHPFYKIGRTNDFSKRIHGLNGTNTPLNYNLERLFEKRGVIHTHLEDILHSFFQDKRLSSQREFFCLNQDDLKKCEDIAQNEGWEDITDLVVIKYTPDIEDYEKIFLQACIQKGIFTEEYGYFWDIPSFKDFLSQFKEDLEEIEYHNSMCEYWHVRADQTNEIPPEEYDDCELYDEDILYSHWPDEIVDLALEHLPYVKDYFREHTGEYDNEHWN